jgi:hypothetical protein
MKQHNQQDEEWRLTRINWREKWICCQLSPLGLPFCSLPKIVRDCVWGCRFSWLVHM